jgi:hypothetical protein
VLLAGNFMMRRIVFLLCARAPRETLGKFVPIPTNHYLSTIYCAALSHGGGRYAKSADTDTLFPGLVSHSDLAADGPIVKSFDTPGVPGAGWRKQIEE